ncbi:MAG: hypothetical protein LBQ95_05435 [Lachnospiraceae bacterium]|jgi:hypothetical protein|nr:hypothetical protein [Lachnospiraceae bacterium]
MAYNTLPELFPEEKAMPLSKYYYDYPMRDLDEELKSIVLGKPMDYTLAVPADRFVDWLKPCGEYEAVENGYCMFPDGSGYICTYTKIPESIEPKKLFWYLNWLNVYPKSAKYGRGNLRYKIWNPADHWDHYFVNWKDPSEGIFTTESLDMGEGDRKYNTIRHKFNLRNYGLTNEKIEQIKASGANVNELSDWESFDEPGSHLTLGQIRPNLDGGFERRSVEWIGYRPGPDGKAQRDPRTKCDEAYLRKVGYHTLIEWIHLFDFLNELYDEYHDQPIDAD